MQCYHPPIPNLAPRALVIVGGDPQLINQDLAPTSQVERSWSTWNMAALWIGMVVCVPTYMLAGGLIDLGMNWWQAVLTVCLGKSTYARCVPPVFRRFDPGY